MSSSTPNPWIYAGPTSSFPNIEPLTSTPNPKTKLHNPSEAADPPPCKILRVQQPQAPQELTPDEAQKTLGFEPQALIFKYRGKIHAIQHNCPHRNYPLSRGSIYDIEDFGVVLSTGITCPGHGWAFDINSGQCSRGAYKLGVWETEVRKGEEEGGEEGVWVRRKEG